MTRKGLSKSGLFSVAVALCGLLSACAGNEPSSSALPDLAGSAELARADLAGLDLGDADLTQPGPTTCTCGAEHYCDLASQTCSDKRTRALSGFYYQTTET